MVIRELKARDMKTLAKLLGKVNPENFKSISTAVKGKAEPMEVGLAALEILAKSTDDIYAWLADLAGMTPEQLDEQGFGAPVEIVKELFQRGDFKDFFVRISQGSVPPTT